MKGVTQDIVTKLARWTIGAAATSRSARRYTAAATQNSIMQIKNTRRPSRSRSRRANNYAVSLNGLQRFEEAKSLLLKTMPVARRALGESYDITLTMRWIYAEALFMDDAATLDDLREAVATLEDTERIARRVLGGAHPITEWVDYHLQRARALLRARETPPPSEPAALPPLPDSDSESDEAPELLSPADVVSQLGNAVSDGKYRA